MTHLCRFGRASALAMVAGMTLSACQPACSGGNCTTGPADLEAQYLGVETRLLEGDLVNFRVQMAGDVVAEDLHGYAECAAAQYALIRGFGFARHVRTQISEAPPGWAADAVYLVSPALPRGLKTIDAEVTVENCRENNIPTV